MSRFSVFLMHKRDCTPSMRHKNICVSNLAGNEAQIRKKGECAQGGACPTVAQPSPCAGRCAEAHPMAGRFDGYPRSCRSGIHARRFFAVGHKWPTYALLAWVWRQCDDRVFCSDTFCVSVSGVPLPQCPRAVLAAPPHATHGLPHSWRRFCDGGASFHPTDSPQPE